MAEHFGEAGVSATHAALALATTLAWLLRAAHCSMAQDAVHRAKQREW